MKIIKWFINQWRLNMNKIIIISLIGFIIFIGYCLNFYLIKSIKCPYLKSLSENSLIRDITIKNDPRRIFTVKEYLTYKNLWYCKYE